MPDPNDIPPGEYTVRPLIQFGTITEQGVHVDAIVEIHGGEYDGAMFAAHVYDGDTIIPIHYDGDR